MSAAELAVFDISIRSLARVNSSLAFCLRKYKSSPFEDYTDLSSLQSIGYVVDVVDLVIVYFFPSERRALYPTYIDLVNTLMEAIALAIGFVECNSVRRVVYVRVVLAKLGQAKYDRELT